jgi:2-polyprenyl-3-methyl-5-hydroxy-6-metoxy-1,4-benzoquinol methylase
MDRADLETLEGMRTVDQLNELIETLARAGLTASTWFGELHPTKSQQLVEQLNRPPGYEPWSGAADDTRYPWFLYWEIAWVWRNAPLHPGDRVLDLGGASSLFSFFLASQGVDVTTVDVNRELVTNGNLVAASLGWSLENRELDIHQLARDEALRRDSFDHVTSICVFEHLPASSRVRASADIAKVVRPGGTVSLTFDYRSPARLAQIDSPRDVHDQFAEPRALEPLGNPIFYDNGLRYLVHPAVHPDAPLSLRARFVAARHVRAEALLRPRSIQPYTFGALFMERVGD